MRIFLHYGVPMRVDFLCHAESKATEYLDPYAFAKNADEGVPTHTTLRCDCGEGAVVTFIPGEHGGVEVLTHNVSVKRHAEPQRA